MNIRGVQHHGIEGDKEGRGGRMKPYSIARACLLNKFSDDWKVTIKLAEYAFMLEALSVDIWIEGVWYLMDSEGVMVARI